MLLEKNPRQAHRGFFSRSYDAGRGYLLTVLSRQVTLVPAHPVDVGVTVMSPLAVIVYTVPAANVTPVLVITLVLDPAYRVLRV